MLYMDHIKALLRLRLQKIKRFGRAEFQLISQNWNYQHIGIPGKQVFAGYYDFSPFSADDDQILLHVIGQTSQPAADAAELVVFDLSSRETIPIADTRIWSWQLGARLCWLDRKRGLVAANTEQNSCVGSSIWSQKNNKFELEKQLSFPVFDWSNDAKKACSLNFSRLEQQRPGYGYSLAVENTENDMMPEDDGVFLVDVEHNKKHLVFSIAEAVRLCGLPTNCYYYINHLCWNPSSTRLLFFLVGNNGESRFSRAITINPDGSDAWVWEPNQAVSVSHYSWKSDNEIILTATLANQGFGYYLLIDKYDQSRTPRVQGLSEDGHPSVSVENSEKILTDTYPDNFGEQSLMIVDTTSGVQEILARFYSPPQYVADKKCDLHPRWSISGKKICVDTCFIGQRGVSVLTLIS